MRGRGPGACKRRIQSAAPGLHESSGELSSPWVQWWWSRLVTDPVSHHVCDSVGVEKSRSRLVKMTSSSCARELELMQGLSHQSLVFASVGGPRQRNHRGPSPQLLPSLCLCLGSGPGWSSKDEIEKLSSQFLGPAAGPLDSLLSMHLSCFALLAPLIHLPAGMTALQPKTKNKATTPGLKLWAFGPGFSLVNVVSTFPREA